MLASNFWLTGLYSSLKRSGVHSLFGEARAFSFISSATLAVHSSSVDSLLESQAIELNGHSCRVHYGRPYNIKITHEMDITVAKCIFNHIERYILEDVEFNSYEDQI